MVLGGRILWLGRQGSNLFILNQTLNYCNHSVAYRYASVMLADRDALDRRVLTRLARLLALLAPSAVRILMDGVPLRAGHLTGWRGRVGAVLEDDLLLAGTFADNIAGFEGGADQRSIS